MKDTFSKKGFLLVLNFIENIFVWPVRVANLVFAVGAVLCFLFLIIPPLLLFFSKFIVVPLINIGAQLFDIESFQYSFTGKGGHFSTVNFTVIYLLFSAVSYPLFALHGYLEKKLLGRRVDAQSNMIFRLKSRFLFLGIGFVIYLLYMILQKSGTTHMIWVASLLLVFGNVFDIIIGKLFDRLKLKIASAQPTA